MPVGRNGVTTSVRQGRCMNGSNTRKVGWECPLETCNSTRLGKGHMRKDASPDGKKDKEQYKVMVKPTTRFIQLQTK